MMLRIRNLTDNSVSFQPLVETVPGCLPLGAVAECWKCGGPGLVYWTEPRAPAKGVCPACIKVMADKQRGKR